MSWCVSFFLLLSETKVGRGLHILWDTSSNKDYFWVSFNGTRQYIICIKRIKKKSFITRDNLSKTDLQEKNRKGSTNLYYVIMSLWGLKAQLKQTSTYLSSIQTPIILQSHQDKSCIDPATFSVSLLLSSCAHFPPYSGGCKLSSSG